MKKFHIKALAAALIFVFSVPVYAENRLVPVGKAVGIEVRTDGLLVIGTTEINGTNAAEQAGIYTGDKIKAVDGREITASEELSAAVNGCEGSVCLTVERDNSEFTVNAVPSKDVDGVNRLGVWVRDSCAGVGTVTYFNPDDNTFAALGHAVNDVDTLDILPLKSGNILSCNIVSLTKSKRGTPGEINAVFGSDVLGGIKSNTYEGIFGDAAQTGFFKDNEPLEVASKAEVHKGEAYILSDIVSGKTEKYTINIEKITNDYDKSLVVEVTDQRLLDSAGGIVQGMSGSPIIQDDKLVGAVTHVFVNSPSKGYGTLVETMLDEQRKSA